MLRGLVLVWGVLVPFSLLPCLVVAAEKPAEPKQPREIQLTGCRIVLIRQVTLACDRSGILKAIEFREGHHVPAHQRVALIADEVAQATLAVAEKKASNDVDVRFNKKARDVAVIEYYKNQEANEKAAATGKNIVPIAALEIEKLKLAAEKSVLSIEQAENELALNQLTAKQSRAELVTYSVVAPFDGVITRVFKRRGEAVRQGDPIVELVNIDQVRIEGRVALPDIRSVKLKQKVRVKLDDPDFDLPEEEEAFDGQVTFVDVVVDPVTRETRVWADVENRDNILRSGLMAKMVIEVAE